MIRNVKQVVTGSTQYDGAGVKLVRVIGRENVRDFDPFLMLDAFDSDNPDDYVRGFPWHPHRGIETVTYLIEGEIEHGDSIGNKGTINDGCCQWMTAGSGIMHQEMPMASPRMLGAQLWLNLPAKDKMAKPHYRDIRTENIPEVRENGVTVRVIAGDYKGAHSDDGDFVKMLYLDVELAPGARFEMNTDSASTLFVYIVSGEGLFGEGEAHPAKRALLFEEGEPFAASSDKGVRFLLFAGRPLGEPVAWGGPIVMNTRQELQQAFDELDHGTFIK